MVKSTGREHELKVWPEPFAAICAGEKGWEFRYDDRGYAVGDALRLREWEPATQAYTGRESRARVLYILHAGFGLPPGYVIMSIEPLGVEKDFCKHCYDTGFLFGIASAVIALTAAAILYGAWRY